MILASRALGQLDPSSGPAEVQFTGQSPTADTATPIGTSFIQGTGETEEAAPTDNGTVMFVALAVVVFAIYSSRKSRTAKRRR